MKLSENTNVAMPIKNMIGIIIGVSCCSGRCGSAVEWNRRSDGFHVIYTRRSWHEQKARPICSTVFYWCTENASPWYFSKIVRRKSWTEAFAIDFCYRSCRVSLTNRFWFDICSIMVRDSGFIFICSFFFYRTRTGVLVTYLRDITITRAI